MTYDQFIEAAIENVTRAMDAPDPYATMEDHHKLARVRMVLNQVRNAAAMRYYEDSQPEDQDTFILQRTGWDKLTV